MGICKVRIVVEFPEDAEKGRSDLKLSPDIRAVNYPALETRILEIIDKLEVEQDAEEE